MPRALLFRLPSPAKPELVFLTLVLSCAHFRTRVFEQAKYKKDKFVKLKKKNLEYDYLSSQETVKTK